MSCTLALRHRGNVASASVFPVTSRAALVFVRQVRVRERGQPAHAHHQQVQPVRRRGLRVRGGRRQMFHRGLRQR